MKKYSYLDELESKSIYLIREAFHEFGQALAVLWSMGKDSTTMVHLVRKAFLGEFPVRAVHIDTGYKFRQIYEFRDRYAKEWSLPLVVAKNDEAIASGVSAKKDKFECCTALKTEALKKAIVKNRFRAFLVAIRRDEHAIRAKERYFSSRDASSQWDYHSQPLEVWAQYHRIRLKEDSHMRIHPMLHWRELDIWRYIERESIPVIDLYYAHNGKRYRSIGCECCCQPVESRASSIKEIVREIERSREAERAGRAQDKEKEYMMQKLRSLGYM